MANRDIIVIGASAGGLAAIEKIVKDLPADFRGSILIVWHMSPDVGGFVAQLLGKLTPLSVTQAKEGEALAAGCIYVAKPDFHLLIVDEKIHLSRGPKENRFRPAVDPLFRSAAYCYGNRVIGVILSGGLDDGTAGLWSIKQYGGIAIVQDPHDAEVSSMPESAMRQVSIDHSVPADAIAALLVRLSKESTESTTAPSGEQTLTEISIAAGNIPNIKATMTFGVLTPFTCPECHGVLSKLNDGSIVRYRCHTGHAYSVDTLMQAVTEKIEASLYSAMRGMDESVMLLNHIGDHLAENNDPALAGIYFTKAREAHDRSCSVAETIKEHQLISTEAVRKDASLPLASACPLEPVNYLEKLSSGEKV